MSTDDDIQELKEDVKELIKFKTDCEIEKKADIVVKARCALAWSSILGFVALASGIITLYSSIAKDASHAALKVIIGRL